MNEIIIENQTQSIIALFTIIYLRIYKLQNLCLWFLYRFLSINLIRNIIRIINRNIIRNITRDVIRIVIRNIIRNMIR